jgi:hypothetical protein
MGPRADGAEAASDYDPHNSLYCVAAVAGHSPLTSWGGWSSGAISLTRKKLLAKVQRTGPLASGNLMRFCRSALPIHFRNIFFVPLTSSGEHPSSNIGIPAQD